MFLTKFLVAKIRAKRKRSDRDQDPRVERRGSIESLAENDLGNEMIAIAMIEENVEIGEIVVRDQKEANDMRETIEIVTEIGVIETVAVKEIVIINDITIEGVALALTTNATTNTAKRSCA